MKNTLALSLLASLFAINAQAASVECAIYWNDNVDHLVAKAEAEVTSPDFTITQEKAQWLKPEQKDRYRFEAVVTAVRKSQDEEVKNVLTSMKFTDQNAGKTVFGSPVDENEGAFYASISTKDGSKSTLRCWTFE